MDINQLIDSDTSASRPKKEVEKLHSYPPGYQQHREQRPPQPPPLRPPGHHEFRSPSSSSYNSVVSPYQKTPSSTLSTSQYPFPPPSIQSPANSAKAISAHQYEAQSHPFAPSPAQQAYGQTASLPQTPTSITPGSSYPPFQQQRPPSSHSMSTPTSGHAQTPTFLRDSPQQIHAQPRGNFGPTPNHPYLSQPGTPLGPPPSLGRQGSSLRRESPGSYDHKRRDSSGSHAQQLQTPPANYLHNPGLNSSAVYAAHHTQSPPQQHMSIPQNRDRSISVSPKTTLLRQPMMSSVGPGVDMGRNPHAPITPAKRKIGDPRMDDSTLQEQPSAKRSMSLGVGGLPKNGRRQAMSKSPLAVKQELQSSAPHPMSQQETNGHVVPGMTTALPDTMGNLGPWERTITGIIPAEELTRDIMDYIIQIILSMKSMSGSILDMIEIEAKIGHIIDKDTDCRIKIPANTETMLDPANPSLRTTFRSSMTEAQHQQLNRFLNRCLAESQPPPPGTLLVREPRVPLTYIHTRLRDTFYDLTPDALNALPPSILNYVDRRKRPKVRITTDQKDGTQLAKIIKIRISDREIFSPKTPFDWRVSVNLELNYEGDMRGLVETTEGKERRRPDRNKDRVSYTHGPYQVDLTQVKPTEVTHQSEKEHELEIEVSAVALRQQIDLVLANKPNHYEDLVQGFVDNVRTLARHCKQDPR
ncbi:MAG: hypothetical protein Q9169_007519 [Polycauliona sp. 2 TL-2023]